MYQETYTAVDVLAAVADTFVGTDHEDWVCFDVYEGTLRLGNLKVTVEGNKLIWRDMGLPWNDGNVEISDGSYVADIVDEVGTWLLNWTNDIDLEDVLNELQDRFGGGLYRDNHGDSILIEPDGVSVWGACTYEESLYVWATRGSVVDYRPDGTVEVLWDENYPIDPEMIVCGYLTEAVDEALRKLEEGR
nr:MAG TPA: hypothetical protein [Caudoviricetes sp.]